MLLSPPFLLPRAVGESDDDWLVRCMTGDGPGAGAFPVSFNLGWHGGQHLSAPQVGAAVEPVRAVADGTVVALRAPTQPDPNPDHALNYNGGWTSDGLVVLRHETAVGTAQPVTFYSISMHLSALAPGLTVGQSVYRRDELGAAGQIYGAGGRIHFEIVCDTANLGVLAGRTQGPLDITRDGRADVLFGRVWLRVPAGTPSYAQQPELHLSQALQQPPAASRGAPLPPPVPLVATPTSEVLLIAITSRGGDAAQGERGRVELHSYSEDGRSIGAEVIEHDGDYDLFSRASSISQASPAASRPTPAAVMELLRFGRVIGPDVLTPADTPHWRQIRVSATDVCWINLNQAGIRSFSDADLPHWEGWSLIDDSADQDSRCDSPQVRGWLDEDRDGVVRPSEAQARLALPQNATRLSRAVCRFATDFDAATIEARWGWLRTPSDENPTPLSELAFGRLRAHIAALAFWSPAIGLDVVHWHWQPREFIRHFRRCTWLSQRELAQTVIRSSTDGLTPWAAAFSRVGTFYPHLSQALRRFGFADRVRQAHFMGQCVQETGYLRLMREGGWRSLDYAPYYGRGFTQLTWAKNYISYGTFRGYAAPHAFTAQHFPAWHRLYQGNWYDGRPSAAQLRRRGRAAYTLDGQMVPSWDVEQVADDPMIATDSGGFYWVWKALRDSTTRAALGMGNIQRLADAGLAQAQIDEVTYNTNGGWNGRDVRRQTTPFAWSVLGDEPWPVGVARQIP